MRAALYLRSSKDRHDVSIDAQRRELTALAKARQHKVVAEFADAVESGKDEDREGFQSLLAAIRNPRRGWDTVLVLDTSRIARRRHIAYFFEDTCRRAGVAVVFKNMPESDPVTDTLLRGIMQALDEWHSLTSKQKGLAGMRENVRQGFRAGGRAPIGYRLEYTETGAMRDGQAVRKSKLVPGADAEAVRAYLEARAAGTKRGAAGLAGVSKASLVGIEWNALTYAGHTVWNVHAEAGSGRKRRPRAEWVVQRDTHPALITDAQADAILSRLEAYAPSNTRQRDAGYLLAGILVSPDGKIFHGDRGAYRIKGRQVSANAVDRAVCSQVLRDIQSPAFVRAVTTAAKAARGQDTAGPLRAALGGAEARLAKLLALVEQTDTPGPLLRQMEAVEAERLALGERLAVAEAEDVERAALSRISEHEVRRLLVDRAAALEQAEPEAMRDALHGLLERVELNGDEIAAHYRIGRPGKSSGFSTSDRGSNPYGIRSAPRGDATLNRTIPIKRKYRIA